MISDKTYQIKKKTNWSLTILVSIWTLGLTIMICVLAIALIMDPSRISDVIAFWLIMVLCAFIALNYLSWQVRGQEILIFHHDHIEIKNLGTFFKRRLRINYFEAEDIDFDNNEETPFWIRKWGIGGGKIKIQFLGHKKRFGQDLTLEDAKTIAEDMKIEFEKRKNKNLSHFSSSSSLTGLK